MSAEEPVRGSGVSLFFASDHALHEPEIYEAVPSQVKYDCGKCGVRINHDFDRDKEATCPNGHPNRRPESVKVVWSGQSH